jgi:uncharacterized delta-60 repeat protein
MKKLVLITLCLAIFFNSPAIFAQAGKLDETFGKKGFTVFQKDVSSLGFSNKNTVALPDGKILIASDYIDDAQPDNYFARVVRLDVNGNFDNTFGTKGQAVIDFGLNETLLFGMETQPDGKILLTGLQTNDVTNTLGAFIVRLTADGKLDATFGTKGIAIISEKGQLTAGIALAVQSDGKIVVAGATGNIATQNVDGAVFRVDKDGKLDKTFGTNGFFKMLDTTVDFPVEYLLNLTLMSSDVILIGGIAGDQNEDVYQGLLLKLSKDGKLDATFANKGLKYISGLDPADLVYFGGVEVLKSGKLLVQVTVDDNITTETQLIRLMANGTEDPTFGTKGTLTTTYNNEDFNSAMDLKILPNGQILTSVESINSTNDAFYNCVSRFNSDGTLDKKFGTAGVSLMEIDSITAGLSNLLVMPNNKIVVMLEGESVDNQITYGYFYRLLNPDVVATNDVKVLENISISPNPTFDQVTLSYQLAQAQKEVQVDLVSLEGRVVANLLQTDNRPSGANQERLTLPAGLVSGLYFVRIKTPEQVTQVKVMKL